MNFSYFYGNQLGYTAGTMSSIMEDLDLSIAQFSVFGSLLTFGGMIGAIFSAKSADAFGRKMTLWLAEGFCISGWLAIALAKNVIWLDLGRFFVGIGVGLISYVIPVYIAEITPKNVRGTFTFSNQLLQNCGLATVLSWKFHGMENDSPYREGGDEECKVVLQKLRGKEANVMKETREIMIGVGLMLLQQLSGSAGISYYAGSIFELAGFPSRIGMTVLSLVVVRSCKVFIKSVYFICCYLHFTPGYIELTFNMMFAAGLGALPWIIMSEIFPMDMKAVAGSLVAITNWFTGWIVSYCFNFMLIWSQSGTFSIFAMISGLTILFAWCLVPETRGLSLEEIQLPHAILS
ncbi:hypothetical protein YC2023_068672 [Brassica napus]